MEAQDLSSQEKENLAGEVMESLGEPDNSADDIDQSHSSEGNSATDSFVIQKRLKQQKRAFERELRERDAMIADLQSRIPNPNYQSSPEMENFNSQHMTNEDERIHKAVRFAFQQKEMEERNAIEAQRRAYINQRYQDLDRHLDTGIDKYPDFDDVVRGRNASFTTTMRDTAAVMPTEGDGSALEVLYHLGKNKSELERIAKLHPEQQVSEMMKLSHVLVKGGEQNKSSQSSRPLGQIKTNPVSNSRGITGKTSVREIMEMMKKSNWK